MSESNQILADLDKLAQLAPDFSKASRIRLRRIIAASIIVISAGVTSIAFVMLRDPNILLGFLGVIVGVLAIPDTNESELIHDSDRSFIELRDRVRRYWLEGSLRPSMEEAQILNIPITLNLKAVINHRQWLDEPVQFTSDIRKLYDGWNSFAVLGAPGSGKTTVMMQLALNFLLDETYKYKTPFLLNLSSWRPNKTLHEWILIEGEKSYRLNQSLINRWLDDKRLILLLDGFDEIPEEYRTDCIRSINEFQEDKTGGNRPEHSLVIATRTAEFRLASDDMKNGFKVNGAIEIQPLEKEMIEGYLENSSLIGLKKLYDENHAVQEMASTPFLLNSMAYVYRDKPLTALEPELKTVSERQQHLFELYLEKRLLPLPREYRLPQVKKWLAWLATKTGYYGTIFRVENVDLSWFDDMPQVKAWFKIFIGCLIFLTLLPLGILSGYSLMPELPIYGAIYGGGLGVFFSLILSKSSPLDFYVFSWRHREMSPYGTIVLMDSLSQFVFIPVIMIIANELSIIYFSLIIFLLLVLMKDNVPYFGELNLRNNLIYYIKYTILIWLLSQPFPHPLWKSVIFLCTAILLIFITFMSIKAFDNRNYKFSFYSIFEHISPFLMASIVFFIISPSNNYYIIAFILMISLWFYGFKLFLSLFVVRLILLKQQPVFIYRYLNLMCSKQIMRNMGGGYIFRHDALRVSLLESNNNLESQAKVIIRDLSNDNASNALDNLILYKSRAVPPLIEALSDTNVKIRWAVALALGKIRDERAVLPLIEAMGDTDKEVRKVVALALGKIRDERAVPPLIEALGDTDNGVKRDAVIVLSSFGELAVIPLIIALSDVDWVIRYGAAKTLKEIGWKPENTEQEVQLLFALQSWQDLISLGEFAVIALIAALSDADRGVRRVVAEILGEMRDDRVVIALIAALSDADRGVRRTVAVALGKIGNEQAVSSLIKALGDRGIRREVVKILLEMRDERVTIALIAALKDVDSEVRRTAAVVLGKIGNEQAVLPLITALDDANSNVQMAAAVALGKIGNEQAVLPLITALGDVNKRGRWIVAVALGWISDERVVSPLIAALGDADSGVRRAVAETLGKIGDERAVSPLIAALGDADRRSQWAIIETLVQMGNERVVPPLIAALGDADSGVRWAAAETLGKIGDERAVSPLIAALGDADRRSQWAIIETLVQMGNERVVPPLITALDDADSGVRWAVVETLGKIGDDRAVSPLIMALDDVSKDVQRAAAEILGKIGDDRAVSPLITALDDADIMVQMAAAWALGKIGGERAVSPLITALDDADSMVQMAAAWALGKIGGERAVSALIAALGDDDRGIRWAVVETLGKIGDDRAVSPLIKALDDADSEVQRAAAWALGKIGDERAVVFLTAALYDGNNRIQNEAEKALKNIRSKMFKKLQTTTEDSFE